MIQRTPRTDPLASEREHLQSIAYRMLGSTSEAEDAVQEACLRLTQQEHEIDNVPAWLTTVVARICLDQLRARKVRRELAPSTATRASDTSDPERDLLLASSVGVALLVILETLPPAERVAFVLHDLFELPFEEIGPILERTPTAARQLASRARRRVRGAPEPRADRDRQQALVEAFLTASRAGDLTGLIAILAPDAVLRADAVAQRGTRTPELRGAEVLAKQAIGAGARAAQAARIDGEAGVVVAPRGKLLMVLRFTVRDGRIAALDAIGEPAALARMTIEMI